MNASNTAAYITALVSFMTTVAMFLKLKTDNDRSRAEITKLLADASKSQKEETFIGISVVRDISEASAVLLVPLKKENQSLWDRVSTLETKVDTLQGENDTLRRSLHEERDRNQRAQVLYEERQKEIMKQHQREMAILEARISGGDAAEKRADPGL